MELSHWHQVTMRGQLCEAKRKGGVAGRHSLSFHRLGEAPERGTCFVCMCLRSSSLGGEIQRQEGFLLETVFHRKFFRSLWLISWHCLTPWNLTHKTYHQISQILWHGAVLKFFSKKLPDPVVKGINGLCEGSHSLVRIPTAEEAKRSLWDTEGPVTSSPCHLFSHQEEKGPLEDELAISLLYFKWLCAFLNVDSSLWEMILFFFFFKGNALQPRSFHLPQRSFTNPGRLYINKTAV